MNKAFLISNKRVVVAIVVLIAVMLSALSLKNVLIVATGTKLEAKVIRLGVIHRNMARVTSGEFQSDITVQIPQDKCPASLKQQTDCLYTFNTFYGVKAGQPDQYDYNPGHTVILARSALIPDQYLLVNSPGRIASIIGIPVFMLSAITFALFLTLSLLRQKLFNPTATPKLSTLDKSLFVSSAVLFLVFALITIVSYNLSWISQTSL